MYIYSYIYICYTAISIPIKLLQQPHFSWFIVSLCPHVTWTRIGDKSPQKSMESSPVHRADTDRGSVETFGATVATRSTRVEQVRICRIPLLPQCRKSFKSPNPQEAKMPVRELVGLVTPTCSNLSLFVFQSPWKWLKKQLKVVKLCQGSSEGTL